MGVSFAFGLSLPHLEDYTKYTENETAARDGSLAAGSALERAHLLEIAEKMSRLRRTSLSQGATAIAIPVLGIVFGAVFVASRLIHRKMTRDFRLLRVLTSVSRAGLIIIAGACAFLPIVVVIGLFLMD